MIKACIATCIKDETEYLNDFIKYHLDLGIDKIFIYEDYGSVSHKEITDKYEQVELSSILDIFPEQDKNDVIKRRIEKTPSQTLYINQILKVLHEEDEYDWCFLTDIDEFITCTEPFKYILQRYKNRDAIILYWQNYGSSGHIYKPVYDKPIWEIYTEPCGYELYSDLKHFKITKFCVNMRKYKPTQKYYIHNALVNWVKADGSFKRTEIVLEPLYLRHYITKSVEEFCWKVWIRGMHHNGHRQWKSLFEMCPEVKEKIDENFISYFKQKYGVDLPEF